MASAPRGADTTYTKIFVGGLAWETQCETMRRYFEQFGDILEAVVITDKNTGRSKGYGFVTFRDPEAARRACQDPSPVIDGRRTNCNLAYLGAHKSSPASPLYQGARFLPYVSDFSGHVYGGAHHFGQPMPFAYQQGYPFALPFGYPAFGPEVYGAQNVYPFMGPQFPTVYTPPSPTFHQQQPDQTQGTSPVQQQTQAQQQHMLQGITAIPPPSPPHPPLVGSLYVPPPIPHYVPIPFQSSAGLIPPTVAPGQSSQRFKVPSPSAQPFTPGGSSDQSSG